MSKDIVQKAIENAAKEGRAPEQEDFLTVALLSNNKEEREIALQDLRAIEMGTSTESIGSFAIEDTIFDPAWCPDCNRDTAFCACICHYCQETLEECECDD